MISYASLRLGSNAISLCGNILANNGGRKVFENMDVYSVAKMIREYSSLLRQGSGYTFVAKLERGISTEDALKDNWFLE